MSKRGNIKEDMEFSDKEANEKLIGIKEQLKKILQLSEEKKQITSFKAIQQDVFDVTGAGDTVISIVASYMTAGKDMI